jgi:hypothetical protein
MSEQRYKAVVTARTARPRSKRLRQAGASASTTGSNVSVTVYGQGEAPTASADGHTHDNKSLLDQLGADSEGYLLLTRLAPVEHTDEETGEVTVAWETVTERIRAGYADHAATADVALSLADDSQLTGKILEEANAYTDQALEQANAYTDQALEQANAYSDQILVLANAYTDIEVGKVRQEIDSLDERYLRRDVPDTAEGLITFNQGIRVYELARMMRVEVTQLATIAQAVVQVMRSSRFVDGILGEGYQLWKAVATGDWCLTIDRLTVRKMMTIYELVIQKLRSVGGTVVVSAANGRIREVACADGRYRITFEDANQFRPGDLMRCQTLTGASTKYYWVEVQAVEGDAVTVPVSEFAGVLPEAGDEVVLMGNTADATRQSLLLLSATEDGQPRFDCYDGVHARNLDGCLRVRTGCLDGISDSRFPATNQPHGYGLYGSNCYLTGTFVLSTGQEVRTLIEAVEGRIQTNVQAITRLDSRLTSAETTIDQTAYAVSLCATRSELNTVSGNLATHTASFHVTADKISSIVSSIDANASSISSLEQTASSLSTSIASTKQTADAARTAADEAASQAAGALSAANAAQVAADAAQSTADSALSKAGTNATAIQQTKDSISVLAGYFDDEGHLIEGAGWVTTAQGNLLWATKDAVTDLQGRMTSAETRITQTESNITLCATKTELNTVSGNLATHTASFHVTSSKISSIVSSIDANASSISSLEQTANSITLQVASSNRTNRNYLLKSGTEVTASTYRFAGYTPAIPLTPSVTYTVQLMVTVPSEVDQIAVYLSSGMIKQANWTGISAGKQLLTATFAAKYYSGMTPGDSAAYAVVELYQYYKGTQATKSVTVHWAKVELGSTATPWCPAPEEETAGRNYYGSHLNVTAYNSASVSRSNSNAPNGLYIVGASSGNGWLRISKVIDGNGYWTVSFWMRGSQSVAGGFNIDMCDAAPLDGNVRVAFRNDNQWVRVEKTFYITNYAEATYHFIDFQSIDWLYIYVKDLKVERGTKATAWCPPVEDSAATKADISLFVTESEVGTLISQAVIRADQIDLVGKVTLTHLDSTIIDGGKIKTSLIDVDNLTVKSCANIGQFTVDNYGLTTTSSTARIAFEWSTNRFIRMNSAETAMFYARNDNGKLMELNAYGSGATALTLLANTSGSGYALSSTGMSRMVARYTSELNTVTGLALGVKSGTTFTGATNVGNTASWVDFLVATGNITLPKASDCPGKIIFIKITGGSRTITSSSTIYKCGDSGTYTSDTFNNRALFFISNGTAWYEFACYTR